MPPLVACGRTWGIGSDDLVFPGIISLLVRVLWLVGIAIGLAHFRDALLCEPAHLLLGFSSTVIFMLVLTILIETFIIGFSARGTIVKAKLRKPVINLLHLRMVVFALEIMLLIVGTVFAFKTQREVSKLECSNFHDTVLITQVVVVISWFVVFLITSLILLYLDPCHCYSSKVDYSILKKHINETGTMEQAAIKHLRHLRQSVWENRLRVVCCCAGSDDAHQMAYREVAELFANLFYERNLVVSDIAAGLVLLQQKANKSEESFDCETIPLNFQEPKERQVFRDCLHYLNYALATYSWPLFVYMNFLCGCCALCSKLRCSQNAKGYIVDDNWCHCYYAGMQNLTGLDENDIFWASFENDIYRVPFAVFLDRECQSVVVAIRGTLSFHDIVTDLTMSTDPMQVPGHPDFLAHRGMLKTATWILERLDEQEILQRAFSSVPDYRLVVVGHSLGSGCACVLSILLHSRYPDLHCYCYSSTNALLNEAAAKYTETFITSVTLGKDLIARLNVHSALTLMEEIIGALETCKKPKYRILLEGGLETLCKCFGRVVSFESSQQRTSLDIERLSDPGEETLQELNPEDSIEFIPLLQRDSSSLRLHEAISGSEDSSYLPVPLFPAGKIIHIMDTGPLQACCCGQRQFEARWAGHSSFNRVIVSPEMIGDHFPDVLLNAMKTVLNQHTTEAEDSTQST